MPVKRPFVRFVTCTKQLLGLYNNKNRKAAIAAAAPSSITPQFVSDSEETITVSSSYSLKEKSSHWSASIETNPETSAPKARMDPLRCLWQLFCHKPRHVEVPLSQEDLVATEGAQSEHRSQLPIPVTYHESETSDDSESEDEDDNDREDENEDNDRVEPTDVDSNNGERDEEEEG